MGVSIEHLRCECRPVYRPHLLGYRYACRGGRRDGRRTRRLLPLAPRCNQDQSAMVLTPDLDSEEHIPTYIKAPGRVVAFGDVHGDIHKAVTALELAGVLKQVDQCPVWCGGNTVVVQLGDILDRGDIELGCLMLFDDLNQQARKEGGAIYIINGNHEVLTCAGNFSFATRGGMMEAGKAAGLTGPDLRNLYRLALARKQVYRRGGPVARMLARNPVVLVVNDTLFAHGGVLPQHVDFGLQDINDGVAEWFRGDKPASSKNPAQMQAMGDMQSIVWNRMYGSTDFKEKGRSYVSRTLHTVLDRVGATAMVIGHTPQRQGANVEFDGHLWRLDVGMSIGVLNALPQVLEITKDENNQSMKRLLTAIPMSSGIPIGVPYCHVRW